MAQPTVPIELMGHTTAYVIIKLAQLLGGIVRMPHSYPLSYTHRSP